MRTWSQAKVTVEATERVSATKRAHGEPMADWTSVVRESKVQRGRLEDEELLEQRYHEAFEEGLHDGTLEAETFTHVVSLADEKKQRAPRPEPEKQLELHLESTLTVQTKRRCITSVEPLPRRRVPTEERSVAAVLQRKLLDSGSVVVCTRGLSLASASCRGSSSSADSSELAQLSKKVADLEKRVRWKVGNDSNSLTHMASGRVR